MKGAALETIIKSISEQELCSGAAKETIKQAAGIIKRGGLVVFPTETVYGLGGNALDSEAASKIYAAKGRPSDNPLIIHVADPSDAEKYCETNEVYYRLAAAFMPGPLTVILPKKEEIPFSVTGGLSTVAVRCPSNETARALIVESGVPIAAPSANLSGKPSPTCAEYVIEDMNGRVDMIIDGGECDIGLESTIVKIEDDALILLRPGGITCDALLCVCENVKVAEAVTESLGANEKPLSPGMKYRHYAPTSPFVLIDGTDEDKLAFLINAIKKESCAVLCYEEELPFLGGVNTISIGKRGDLDRQARTLFSSLRAADKLGVDIIYGHLPPMEGLGLALYNRMIRAAAHTIKKVTRGE